MKNTAHITLKGNPISVNQLYRGRRFLTKIGKDIKEANYYTAKAQWPYRPFEEAVKVTVRFTFGDKRRHDIDNCLKAVLDSLTGVLWVDDSQIAELNITKCFDPKNPKVDLWVEPTADPYSQ